MRNPKYHVYLTPEERSKVIEALIFERDKLLAAGRYTDGVDELLVKLSHPKVRKVKVVYTG